MSKASLIGSAKIVGVVVLVLVLLHQFGPKQLKDYTGTM